MPCSCLELEARERLVLASYAQFSADSLGRAHPERPPQWRTQYQRDRDRVIHSRAFRRLEYKTQVFLNGTGDHFRTRLTHTMEVAAVSRNISRALRLNEDLAETIALAHDLGHSPFGHKGEMVLARLMAGHGGFEHNRQSLRIVEELEQKYPAFAGLNLTWESREGLVKHHTPFDHPSRRAGFAAKSSALEAQVANLADEVTYYSHDLDDGIESGLLSEAALVGNVELWGVASRAIQAEYGALADECRRYFIIRTIIDLQVRDVVETTEAHIVAAGVKSADDVRLHPHPLVQYSAQRRQENLELREYLYSNLYYNPVVNEPHQRAGRVLEDLFGHYLAHPEDIGERTRKRADKEGWHRAVCDYIAGMTDRFAWLEHQRLFGVTPRAGAGGLGG
jgi:dGTPase